MSVKNFARNSLLVGGLATLLSLSGCANLQIEKTRDLTGDDIADIQIGYDKFNANEYLFVGQKNGGFKRAEKIRPGKGGTPYYLTDDGKVYFPKDGFYKEHRKLD